MGLAMNENFYPHVAECSVFKNESIRLDFKFCQQMLCTQKVGVSSSILTK